MSYARTSEPNSDVYIFGSGNYLELSIAYNRGAKDPLPKNPSAKQIEYYFSDENSIPFDNIFAGEYCVFDTFSELLMQLDRLVDAGVRVPQSAFDLLRADQKINDYYPDFMKT